MIPIMPKHQSAVCEMALNAVTDCVVVESLRCPYCLGPVEIRQGDNWTTYWCAKHGAVEPISFSTALADGPGSSPPYRMSAASFGIPGGPSSAAGLFTSSEHVNGAMGININLIAVGFPNKRPMILRLCQKKSLSHRASSHHSHAYEVDPAASMSAVRSTGICAGREERQRQTDMVVGRVRQRAVHHRSYAENAVKESGGGTVESDGKR